MTTSAVIRAGALYVSRSILKQHLSTSKTNSRRWPYRKVSLRTLSIHGRAPIKCSAASSRASEIIRSQAPSNMMAVLMISQRGRCHQVTLIPRLEASRQVQSIRKISSTPIGNSTTRLISAAKRVNNNQPLLILWQRVKIEKNNHS